MKVNKRGIECCILSLLVVLFVPETLYAFQWCDGAAPELMHGQRIDVAKGNWVTSGTQILIIEGDTVSLHASPVDIDSCSNPADLTPIQMAVVEWGIPGNGGSLSSTITHEAMFTNYTAPMLDPGESSRTITITARPDDLMSTPPIPVGDTGERDDSPGTSSTLTIKIVKTGPTTISSSSYCDQGADYEYLWEFPNLKKSAGFTVFKNTVYGGTPPAIPGNWNGMIIKESLAVKTGDAGTLQDSHLNYGNVNFYCVASNEGFVVGQAGADLYECTSSTAVNYCFYDTILANYDFLILGSGESEKYLNCLHTYTCNGTTLIGGSITRKKTLKNVSYDPDDGGPASAYLVTQFKIE